MPLTKNATALLDRWQRLELQVRCGLAPDQPRIVRGYVLAGLQLAGQGLKPARDVQRRLRATLSASARDEALPWFWRSLCLEALNRPLTRLHAVEGA